VHRLLGPASSRRAVAAVRAGVIGHGDVRIIAIGGGRFGRNIPEAGLPLVMSALFPIGQALGVLDPTTGELVREGYQSSFTIERQRGTIPRAAFLDDRFAHISGVVWSRVGVGNMCRQVRPLTFVHKPRAAISMPHSWGVWDHEYIYSEYEDRWEVRDILSSNS
jgi:hypothetical protein